MNTDTFSLTIQTLVPPHIVSNIRYTENIGATLKFIMIHCQKCGWNFSMKNYSMHEYEGYPRERCWAWNTTVVWDDMYSLYVEFEGENLMNQQGSIMSPHCRRMSAEKNRSDNLFRYLREKWIIIKWTSSDTQLLMKADRTISDLFSWKTKLFNWKFPFDMYIHEISAILITFCQLNTILHRSFVFPHGKVQTWCADAQSIYARATGRKPRSSKRFCDWKCSCNRDREIFFLMLWKTDDFSPI